MTDPLVEILLVVNDVISTRARDLGIRLFALEGIDYMYGDKVAETYDYRWCQNGETISPLFDTIEDADQWLAGRLGNTTE